MATKITLTIEAAEPQELADAVLRLADLYGDGALPDTGEGATSLPPSQPRRRNAKKAEPAAQPATETSGSPAATVDAGAVAGPIATTAASPSEPAVAEVTAASLLDDGGPAPISADVVRAKMQEAMAKASPLKVQEALEKQSLGKRFSEIPTDKWGEAMNIFEAIIAAS